MSEQETKELIQRYRERYRTNGHYDEISAWEFLANSLARDLIDARSKILYMNEKLRILEKMNDTAKTE